MTRKSDSGLPELVTRHGISWNKSVKAVQNTDKTPRKAAECQKSVQNVTFTHFSAKKTTFVTFVRFRQKQASWRLVLDPF